MPSKQLGLRLEEELFKEALKVAEEQGKLVTDIVRESLMKEIKRSKNPEPDLLSEHLEKIPHHKLKEAFKEMGFVHKDDIPSLHKMKEELPLNEMAEDHFSLEEVLHHLKHCDNPECKLHRLKNDIELHAMKKGIVYGYALGKY